MEEIVSRVIFLFILLITIITLMILGMRRVFYEITVSMIIIKVILWIIVMMVLVYGLLYFVYMAKTTFTSFTQPTEEFLFNLLSWIVVGLASLGMIPGLFKMLIPVFRSERDYLFFYFVIQGCVVMFFCLMVEQQNKVERQHSIFFKMIDFCWELLTVFSKKSGDAGGIESTIEEEDTEIE